MVQATKATSTTRRRFLAAAPAALAIGATTVAAARASDVSPELSALVEKHRALEAEKARLDALYDAAEKRMKAIWPKHPDELKLMKWSKTMDRRYYRHLTRQIWSEDHYTGDYFRLYDDARLAKIADDYVAAEDRAEEESGVNAQAAVYEALLDRIIPIEVEIMTFPARTFGEVVILARLAWEQMTRDPGCPTPFDAFVKYLVPAVLRLDVEADQAALDKWLADLNEERAEA